MVRQLHAKAGRVLLFLFGVLVFSFIFHMSSLVRHLLHPLHYWSSCHFSCFPFFAVYFFLSFIDPILLHHDLPLPFLFQLTANYYSQYDTEIFLKVPHVVLGHQNQRTPVSFQPWYCNSANGHFSGDIGRRSKVPWAWILPSSGSVGHIFKGKAAATSDWNHLIPPNSLG